MSVVGNAGNYVISTVGMEFSYDWVGETRYVAVSENV